ncbi:ornithine cyclodeaminase family protein, partial [Desulfococcus sp.]|uniref:ornithine cyclodeaminase family protein n=1 Tax=Desulfococcus sp. TaxID=2025834 RepID=UPI003593009B
ARDAVDGADIICTATTSPTPVLLGDWIAPGAHINAVGAYQPHTRELDTAAVAGARLYVDRLESALNEAGEFILPRDEGAIGRDHIIGELGALLSGKIPGRQSPRDVTLFKSLGIAVEDLAAARRILDLAVEKKIGTFVDFCGRKPMGRESAE